MNNIIQNSAFGRLWFAAASMVAFSACSSSEADEIPAAAGVEEATDGELTLAFGYHDGQHTSSHDVTQLHYVVVNSNDPHGCNGEVLAEKTVRLETEDLPANLDPDNGDGTDHRFGDALFVLPPGDYLVCVEPQTRNGNSSQECLPTLDDVKVFAEQTTEIVMISECEGDPTGAGDIVVALNDPPRIDDLSIYPSKFITTCERAKIRVSASDPNADDLAYTWSIVSKPGGSHPWLWTADSSAFFKTTTKGDYDLKVLVTDAHGREAALRFPIHVSKGDCGVCPMVNSASSGDVEPLHQDGCED